MIENTKEYIRLTEVTELLQIETNICKRFAEVGIIRIIEKENIPYIEPREVPKLRHAVSLYRDLGVNEAGIDVIFSMRRRMIRLQEEIVYLKREVNRLEQEYILKNIELPRQRGQFFEV